jgi:hypothetical protein
MLGAFALAVFASNLLAGDSSIPAGSASSELQGQQQDSAMQRATTATSLSAGEQINWQVISSGGENGGMSASYRLAGTVGQSAVGSGSSTNYGLSHGFWQDFALCDAIIGDANNAGIPPIDIDDVVYLIAYIFSGGPPPMPYPAASGDADCSCVDPAVDIDDVVFLIAYIFSGGPPPCACEEWVSLCGIIR